LIDDCSQLQAPTGEPVFSTEPTDPVQPAAEHRAADTADNSTKAAQTVLSTGDIPAAALEYP
jgi:hypothetical protein